MTIEELQQICEPLPGVTTGIKWDNDLCFCVGGKMFLVVGLGQAPPSASFKVMPEVFSELTAQPGFVPAPYLARHHWVLTDDISSLAKQKWEHYVRQSYELVVAKLPKKVLKELGLI